MINRVHALILSLSVQNREGEEEEKKKIGKKQRRVIKVGNFRVSVSWLLFSSVIV